MTEHTKVSTELIKKIEKLIDEHNEGFVKVYFDENHELDTDWYSGIGDMDMIEDGENFSKCKERYIVTYALRRKPFTQSDIVQRILVKVNIQERKKYE